MLYSFYKDFLCKERIHDGFSKWYEMSCGIHQGDYLSLLKYVAFINTLLVELKESKICCALYNIQSSSWVMPTILPQQVHPKISVMNVVFI